MDTQILVPLDGSPRAEAILATVLPLAAATGRGLTLLQVLTVDSHLAPVPGLELPSAVLIAPAQEEHRAVAGYLAGAARRFARPGWPVQTAILAGAPAAAILAYAQQHPAVRLIALATHGRRGVRRWILGSLAEEVLHHAPVPVLLLRLPAGSPPAGPAPVFKTIVVPVDQSAFAEVALAQATALARGTGARLVLATAVAHLDGVPGESEPLPPWWHGERQAEVDRLVRYQEQLASRIEQDGVQVGMHIADGHPADVILQLAADIQADLIVMATHGRTGFGRFRLGSVALAVAERATGPVVLVRVPAGSAPAIALDVVAGAAPAGGARWG